MLSCSLKHAALEGRSHEPRQPLAQVLTLGVGVVGILWRIKPRAHAGGLRGDAGIDRGAEEGIQQL